MRLPRVPAAPGHQQTTGHSEEVSVSRTAATEQPLEEERLGEVLWRRRDTVSLERCRITRVNDSHAIVGTVITVADGRPFQVGYLVQCGLDWVTRQVHVSTAGAAGGRSLDLARDASGRWTRGGSNPAELTELAGLADIDLQITPSTNTLPIRRLGLSVGEKRGTDAVWIRFPELSVQRLTQEYERLAEHQYRYSSNGGRFSAELEVNDRGIVTRYGEIWERVVP